MTFARISSGRKGERIAASYLKNRGYKIISKNYRTKLGEIDIIGDDNGCISFIEVRSMNGGQLGSPEYTINRKKQDQIAKTALLFIKRRGLEDKDCRFDVLCVEGVDGPFPKIKLTKNAFDLPSGYNY